MGPSRVRNSSALADKVRFYCESCGKQVRSRDKICPHCGRFFTKVRCPACNLVGDAELFLNGCPSCGYLGKAQGYHQDKDHLFETVYIEDAKQKSRKRPGMSPAAVLALVAALGFLITALAFLLTR